MVSLPPPTLAAAANQFGLRLRQQVLAKPQLAGGPHSLGLDGAGGGLASGSRRCGGGAGCRLAGGLQLGPQIGDHLRLRLQLLRRGWVEGSAKG